MHVQQNSKLEVEDPESETALMEALFEVNVNCSTVSGDAVLRPPRRGADAGLFTLTSGPSLRSATRISFHTE